MKVADTGSLVHNWDGQNVSLSACVSIFWRISMKTYSSQWHLILQTPLHYPLVVKNYSLSIFHFVFCPIIRCKREEKRNPRKQSMAQLKLTLVLFYAAVCLVLVPSTHAKNVKYCGQFSHFLGYHLIDHEDRKLPSSFFSFLWWMNLLSFAIMHMPNNQNWNLWFLFHKGFGAVWLWP